MVTARFSADLASAVNPIGDLFKTQVRQMARAMNLPAAIIGKPPSADLWEGQSDEEDLGISYDEVDRILYLMFDERFRRSELLEAGFAEEQVTKVYGMVRRNHSSAVPPIIAKISDRTIEREFRYAARLGALIETRLRYLTTLIGGRKMARVEGRSLPVNAHHGEEMVA